MVQLDLSSFIFDENESEERQTFMVMVDLLAKPESEKLLSCVEVSLVQPFLLYFSFCFYWA